MKFSTHHIFIVWPPYLAKQTLLLISVLIREREYFSRNVMMSVGVSRMGKTRVVFIDSGAKANSSYYCNIVLEKGLLPDIRAIYRHYRWTLQQDGAPAHTARATMDYPKKRAHQLHWTSHLASKYSADINPVDYAIWGALQQQQRVYHQRQLKTVEELKRVIVTEWQKLSQRFIVTVTVSMNGVDVLKLLSRMAADTSSIATLIGLSSRTLF